MRVILQCKRETKVETMRNALCFMSIRQRLNYNACIFIFKAVKGLLPNNLSNKVQMVGAPYGRQTRQTDNIIIHFRRTTNAQKSLFYIGIKKYNELPIEVKNSERLEIYKRRLKKYILGLN